ncbi:uncharacterized protein [Dermacentor albipictus]|uniref:uncharacterized protein isoform X2 n=1 Tax=Dermacentor albipictus TaxID=60249 RepID=UPI0031FDD00B
MPQSKVSPTNGGPSKDCREVKRPAVTHEHGKNSSGGPHKRRSRQRTRSGRGRSPPASSTQAATEKPLESAHEQKEPTEEGGKKVVGEGEPSLGKNEAEAKQCVAATNDNVGQKCEGQSKRKVSLYLTEADRQQISEAPAQSSRYDHSMPRPGVFEVPPDDPRRAMFMLPPASGPGASDRKSRTCARRRLTTMDCALAAFVVTCSLAILGALLFGRTSPRPPPRLIKAKVVLERMQGLCENLDCRAAVREVIVSSDPFTNPCRDLQSFACGHWCASANRTMAATYWLEQRRRYVSVVEAAVLRVHRRALFTGQPFDYMASFYASCLGLLGNRKASLADCWRAAGVELPQWTNASDFRTLFALAVDTIVHSDMPSVFKIKFYSDSTVDANTGTAIAATSTDDHYRQMLVEEAAAELGVDAEPLRRKIRDIDDAVRGAIENAPMDAADTSVACSYFDTARVKRVWCEVFKIHHRRSTASHDSSSHEPHARVTSTNSPQAIRVILDALGSADLVAARIYLLLVPLAKFMVLEHRVRPLRGDLSAGARSEVCVRTLQTHVKEVFELWFKTRVLLDGTATDVSRMVKDVRKASSATFKRFKGARLDEYEAHRTTAWVEAVPEYGDDFVANMILLSRSGVAVGRDELVHIATMAEQSAGSHGLCGSNDTSTVDVVAGGREFVNLLLPDVYYTDSNRKVLNYASLGTLLAGEVFDALSSRVDLATPASCLASYVSANMGVALGEVERATVLRTAWVLETAHKAAALREPDVAHNALATRLFVMRFLRTLCGEPEDAARLSRLALATLPIYTLAFNCSKPSEPALC